jgi:hypothetical protein
MIGFSIHALLNSAACDKTEHIVDMRLVRPGVAYDDVIPLRDWWDLSSTSVANRWWSLRLAGDPGKRIAVAGAVRAAKRWLPFVCAQNRVFCLAAIEAAEAWLLNPCPETVSAARKAAEAAETEAGAWDEVPAWWAAAAAWATVGAGAVDWAWAESDEEAAAQRSDLDELLKLEEAREQP